MTCDSRLTTGFGVFKMTIHVHEELDGPAVSVLRRAIVEVKQRWSVTKNVS
jgi:hypothetical protein